MSLSDDEDEFQSADEDNYGEETAKAKEAKEIDNKLTQHRKKRVDEEITSSSSSKNDEDKDVAEDDDEEALAERIRERNLKIARKFSAEIAKNIKSSAPIPVKITTSKVNRNQSDKEEGLLDDVEYPSSNPPPAPPPTPALSSSFSNSQEPPISSITTTELKEDCESAGTRYGWRIPTKSVPKIRQLDSPSTPNVEIDKEPNVGQPRTALDRLVDNTSDSKNLFEKVAEDLKKVSIMNDSSQFPATSGLTAANIPIISELGNSLSGWNWNSASKLLASASQVKSQVGSVLDSVVNVAQVSHQQQSSNSSSSSDSEVRKQLSQKIQDERQKSMLDNQDKLVEEKQQSVKASTSGSDAISNDAFVGFTLNAMESLGKKAFGVMTERDQSGSLQIKGLGRPWEHLLNLKKSAECLGQTEPAQQKSAETKQKTEFECNPYSSRENFDNLDQTSVCTSSEYSVSSKKKTEDQQSNMRNIRRRYKADNDELD